MQIIQITEYSDETSKREIYAFLEQLSSFSMLDCRHCTDISKLDCAEVLVLDHFDETSHPERLLDEIQQSQSHLKAVVLVDQDPDFALAEKHGLEVNWRVVFQDLETCGEQSNAQKHEHLIQLFHQLNQKAA